MQATRSLDSLSSYRENYAYSLGIQAYIYGYPCHIGKDQAAAIFN